jgi:hypothetical protein
LVQIQHNLILFTFFHKRGKIIRDYSNEQNKVKVPNTLDTTFVFFAGKKPTAFLDLCLQLPEMKEDDIREEVETFMFAVSDVEKKSTFLLSSVFR